MCCCSQWCRQAQVPEIALLLLAQQSYEAKCILLYSKQNLLLKLGISKWHQVVQSSHNPFMLFFFLCLITSLFMCLFANAELF